MRARVRAPVATSHTRMVPSSPPVARWVPSGLSAMHEKLPRCRRVSTLQLSTPFSSGGRVTRARGLSGSPSFSASGSAGTVGAGGFFLSAAYTAETSNRGMQMTKRDIVFSNHRYLPRVESLAAPDLEPAVVGGELHKDVLLLGL